MTFEKFPGLNQQSSVVPDRGGHRLLLHRPLLHCSLSLPQVFTFTFFSLLLFWKIISAAIWLKFHMKNTKFMHCLLYLLRQEQFAIGLKFKIQNLNIVSFMQKGFAIGPNSKYQVQKCISSLQILNLCIVSCMYNWVQIQNSCWCWQKQFAICTIEEKFWQLQSSSGNNISCHTISRNGNRGDKVTQFPQLLINEEVHCIKNNFHLKKKLHNQQTYLCIFKETWQTFLPGPISI